MTNQNPASSQTQPSNINSDILAKVNAHADRSIDRLFIDIDELLNDEIVPDNQSSSVERYTPSDRYPAETLHTTNYTARPQHQTYLPQADFSSPQSVEFESSPPAKPGLPLWLKALLGIGMTSIALGSLLFWLINQRKIELPANMDTSWLPFQSDRVSPADAKFADYMQKSLANIEAAKNQANLAANRPNPAPPIATPIAAKPTEQIAPPISFNPSGTLATPSAPKPTGIIATVPGKTTQNVLKTPISLVKTLPNSNRSSAIFQIDGRDRTINVGQKIGTSNWSLLSVAKGEVIVKRKGGEIRSIFVGQKFQN